MPVLRKGSVAQAIGYLESVSANRFARQSGGTRRSSTVERVERFDDRSRTLPGKYRPDHKSRDDENRTAPTGRLKDSATYSWPTSRRRSKPESSPKMHLPTWLTFPTRRTGIPQSFGLERSGPARSEKAVGSRSCSSWRAESSLSNTRSLASSPLESSSSLRPRLTSVPSTRSESSRQARDVVSDTMRICD